MTFELSIRHLIYLLTTLSLILCMARQEFLLCGHLNSLWTSYLPTGTLVLQCGHLFSLFLLCGHLTSLWTPYVPNRMLILLKGHLSSPFDI